MGQVFRKKHECELLRTKQFAEKCSAKVKRTFVRKMQPTTLNFIRFNIHPLHSSNMLSCKTVHNDNKSTSRTRCLANCKRKFAKSVLLTKCLYLFLALLRRRFGNTSFPRSARRRRMGTVDSVHCVHENLRLGNEGPLPEVQQPAPYERRPTVRTTLPGREAVLQSPVSRKGAT